jgi:hypothetical protein
MVGMVQNFVTREVVRAVVVIYRGWVQVRSMKEVESIREVEGLKEVQSIK